MTQLCDGHCRSFQSLMDKFFEIANWRMIVGGAWQCHARTAGNWWVGKFYIIRQFRNANFLPGRRS